MSPAFNPGYATFVGLGLVTGCLAKSLEERRLNLLPSAQRRWVTAGALLGAMIGGLVDHYFFNLKFPHSVVLFWLYVGLGMATVRLGMPPATARNGG